MSLQAMVGKVFPMNQWANAMAAYQSLLTSRDDRKPVLLRVKPDSAEEPR